MTTIWQDNATAFASTPVAYADMERRGSLCVPLSPTLWPGTVGDDVSVECETQGLETCGRCGLTNVEPFDTSDGCMGDHAACCLDTCHPCQHAVKVDGGDR